MNLTASAAVGALALTLGARAVAYGGAMVVYTPSVPVGLYWRGPVTARPLARGATVCLDASSPYAPAALHEGLHTARLPAAWRTQPLVKHVAGVGGDVVRYHALRGVLVQGRALPRSRAKQTDSAGNALPSPTYPLRLATHQVWLTSPHDDGFDSRYFGAVDVRALSCVARPVWTF